MSSTLATVRPKKAKATSRKSILVDKIAKNNTHSLDSSPHPCGWQGSKEAIASHKNKILQQWLRKGMSYLSTGSRKPDQVPDHLCAAVTTTEAPPPPTPPTPEATSSRPAIEIR